MEKILEILESNNKITEEQIATMVTRVLKR